jgi:polysaccharide export outer membrane protein
MKLTIKALVFLHFCFLTFSCTPSRNLVYFSDLKNSEHYKTEIKNSTEIKIQPGDLLSIRLISLNAESNALFNRGVLQPNGTVTSNLNTEAALNEGYLVDAQGLIEFPVLGKVKLSGLTMEESISKMTSQIQQFVKSPIVTIKLLNFKITVIGEVNKPSTFAIPADRVNILEALGLAGDMTAYGKRENVLLIRESNGVRSTTRLNLNNKEILNSQYFYLRQNDVIYVEPDKIKEVQASTNTKTLTIATMAISIAVAIIFNFQNIFK